LVYYQWYLPNFRDRASTAGERSGPHVYKPYLSFISASLPAASIVVIDHLDTVPSRVRYEDTPGFGIEGAVIE